MAESARTRTMRLIMNLFPALRGAGVRITYVSADFSEIHVRLPLNWRTYNAVGSIFGGSMYAACDPFFMLILMNRLGPGYVVWDKSATIHFERPGRRTLHARFHVEPQEIATIKQLLATEDSVTRTYSVDLVDTEGVVYATVEKVIYIRQGERGKQTRGLVSRLLNQFMESIG